ncbi:hypothetical protein B4U79_15287 [Dinothrombium tinctorium]|uniref:C2H2-type domain-containing protein n=1 Tax=Dinothrombium tinctorium TaxID=1965070 RepID=A0A3S3PA60_9ACAR|nr:hypothetical protein B4U79_00304 [Dinothrombium tinctorium]RWS15500.1 hypothetical protein B4U79_01889 [Dinothrombium tinctorium]RWS15506.1 hypothetical protein B4U79_15287 [Dinothrombium tinctorium]
MNETPFLMETQATYEAIDECTLSMNSKMSNETSVEKMPTIETLNECSEKFSERMSETPFPIETEGKCEEVEQSDSENSSDIVHEKHQTIDEMISLFKPCSVVLTRLNEESIEKYRRKISEVSKNELNNIKNGCDNKRSIKEENVSSEDEAIDEEVKIEIPPEDQWQSLFPKNNIDENQTFCCIFCRNKELKPFEEAVEHYQYHLDDYPFKCSLCDEVFFNIEVLYRHFKSNHENETHAAFKKTNAITTKWIKKFLKSQMKYDINSASIKKSCPVCELMHGEILDLPIYATTPKGLPNHVFRHLCYEAFVCVTCLKKGQEFLFYRITERRVYNHILRHHFENRCDDLSTLIKNKYRIPDVEKFIKFHLGEKTIAGFLKTKAKIPSFVLDQHDKKISEKVERSQKINEKKRSSNIELPEDQIPNKQIQTPFMADRQMQCEKKNQNQNSPQTTFPSTIQEVKYQFKSEKPNSSPPLSTMIPIKTYSTIAMANSSTKCNENQTFNVNIIPKSEPSLIVNLSPLETLLNGDNPYIIRYFCIFCDDMKIFTSKLEACSHYAEHLNYYPVVCVICSCKFSDLKSLLSHYALMHSNPRSSWAVDSSGLLLYVVNEDEDIERWIEDFLDFQSSATSWKLFNVRYKSICPVCKKMFNEFSSPYGNLMPIDASVKLHVYQHLNYYPFECILCKKEQKSFRLCLVDSSADSHLQTHSLTDSTSDVFPKTIAIKSLETFICENLVECQKNFTKFKLNSEANFVSSINCSEVVKEIDEKPLNECDIKAALSEPLMETENNKALSEAKVSDSKMKHDRQDSLPKTLLYCYHCHVPLKEWILLKEHHFKVHPTLSLIGYSPNN